MIEAPKGRYRVVERGGRLIVTDTQTGLNASSAVQAAARAAERRAGRGESRSAARASEDVRPGAREIAPRAAPTASGADPAEQLANWWLGNRRDARGRLILLVRGRPAVALDPAQARRLGRPLLAMALATGVALIFAAIWVSVYPLIIGVIGLSRLWNDWYAKTRTALLDEADAPT